MFRRMAAAVFLWRKGLRVRLWKPWQGRKSAALADFISGNGPLPAAAVAADFRVADFCVFLTHAAVYPFPPKVETAAFQLIAHQGNHGGFRKAKLGMNGFEWRAVFPGHFDDAIDVVRGQLCHAQRFLFQSTCTAEPSANITDSGFWLLRKAKSAPYIAAKSH